MSRDVDFLKNSLIAHRGLHNKDNPENSIGAFRRAVNKKNIIELDVHLTKDNKIVVFHDDNLKRMTGIEKKIKLCYENELKKMYLCNTKYTIPTLEEVLKLVDGRVPIIIELKYDNRVGMLEKKLVEILDVYKGEYVIQSFRISSVFWFKINRASYLRGILVPYTTLKFRDFLSKYFIYQILCKPDFLSCNYKLGIDKKIQNIRKKIPVLGWTFRNKEDYYKYGEYYDNLVYENIENLLR